MLYLRALRVVDHPLSRAGLGAALRRLGRLGAARTQLEIAVRLAPEDAGARFELGLVALAVGDRATAHLQQEALAARDPARAATLLNLIRDAAAGPAAGAGPAELPRSARRRARRAP